MVGLVSDRTPTPSQHVAEHRADRAGPGRHPPLRPPLHALRLVCGLAAVPVEVQIPPGTGGRHQLAAGGQRVIGERKHGGPAA